MVLVVIPALNEAHGIAQVLASLSEDLPAHVPVSFVVVDGGSSDRTVETVRRLAATRDDLTLLHNAARIQSAAINLAVRVAGQGAEVLVRCDAHARYPRGFIRRLLETLERTGADSVVVPMDCVESEGAVQRAVGWASDSALGSGGAAHRAGRRSGFVDHGHHAAFRMQSFRRCGGYDESFTHNEDAELDCRTRRLGGRIYLDAGIRVGYEPRAAFAALARQYFRYGRGRSRTMRRHPGSMRLRQLAVPLHFGACLAALALAPWWPALLLWPLAYVLVLAAASLRAAVAHRSPSGLLAGPAAGVMHFSWALGFLDGLLTIREKGAAPGGGAMNVMLVDPSLYTAPYDAALTQGLLAAGVAPTWMTRPLRRGDRAEIPPERTDAFFYRRTDGGHALLKGLAHVAGMAKLLWKIRRDRPQVVHVQWIVVPPVDIVAMALIRRWCPLVLTVHDTVPYNGQRMSALQRLGHAVPARLAHRVIVHTRSGAQTLQRHGVHKARISVIPHGPLRLSVAAAPAGSRDARWTFVLFGEIKPYKGLDVLIEAVAALPVEVRDELRVVVAGRPRMDMTPLQARIAALGLGGQFELRLQRLSEQEMAALFAEADCFVLPYRQIDASGVYYLVRSLGKWLIASRVGVFAESMGDEEGALVTPGDAACLSEALRHATVQRPPGEAGARATSWSDIGHATHRLYEDALAEFADENAPHPQSA